MPAVYWAVKLSQQLLVWKALGAAGVIVSMSFEELTRAVVLVVRNDISSSIEDYLKDFEFLVRCDVPSSTQDPEQFHMWIIKSTSSWVALRANLPIMITSFLKYAGFEPE